MDRDIRRNTTCARLTMALMKGNRLKLKANATMEEGLAWAEKCWTYGFNAIRSWANEK